MGREATCEAELDGKAVVGKARLEEKEVVFRGGEVRLKIPFTNMRSVEARGGRLVIVHGGGRAVLALGVEAAKWAEKILNPPSRLDKLGIKPGVAVSVIGLQDAAFDREVAARGVDASIGRVRAGSQVVLLRIDRTAGLERLAALREKIAQDGAIWVLWPKGRKELREDDVRREAIRVGLVDVKVASFSDELSALKLVIPRALRAAGSPRARG